MIPNDSILGDDTGRQSLFRGFSLGAWHRQAHCHLSLPPQKTLPRGLSGPAVTLLPKRTHSSLPWPGHKLPLTPVCFVHPSGTCDG